MYVSYRVAKKANLYQESSLNCIKNRELRQIFHQFWLQNQHKDTCIVCIK